MWQKELIVIYSGNHCKCYAKWLPTYHFPRHGNFGPVGWRTRPQIMEPVAKGALGLPSLAFGLQGRAVSKEGIILLYHGIEECWWNLWTQGEIGSVSGFFGIWRWHQMNHWKKANIGISGRTRWMNGLQTCNWELKGFRFQSNQSF